MDIENYYESKNGQSMERIWTFCKRAQGELPLPRPEVKGHQPSEEHVDGLTAKVRYSEIMQLICVFNFSIFNFLNDGHPF